jgi:hypothetical protein
MAPTILFRGVLALAATGGSNVGTRSRLTPLR